ncbi:MAG TPA: hypothetical protein VGE24_12230 [Emticicia sp.]
MNEKKGMSCQRKRFKRNIIKVPVTETEPEKVVATVNTFLHQKSVKVTTKEAKPEKVVTTVYTFLNDGFMKVFSTQPEPEKVDLMVGTFLKKARIDWQTINKI